MRKLGATTFQDMIVNCKKVNNEVLTTKFSLHTTFWIPSVGNGVLAPLQRGALLPIYPSSTSHMSFSRKAIYDYRGELRLREALRYGQRASGVYGDPECARVFFSSSFIVFPWNNLWEESSRRRVVYAPATPRTPMENSVQCGLILSRFVAGLVKSCSVGHMGGIFSQANLRTELGGKSQQSIQYVVVNAVEARQRAHRARYQRPRSSVDSRRTCST